MIRHPIQDSPLRRGEAEARISMVDREPGLQAAGVANPQPWRGYCGQAKAAVGAEQDDASVAAERLKR